MLLQLCLEEQKNHPNKTKDMDDAIVIFEKWMRMYKRKKDLNLE